MGETVVGGLAARGILLEQFEWMMSLPTLELGDGRTVSFAYCGVTGDGLMHVCFHVRGEGFYYAGLPVAAAKPHCSARHDGDIGYKLEFPPATGLRVGTSEPLTPDVLEGLTAAWLRFWKPAINQGWGKGALNDTIAVGQFSEFYLAEGAFGLQLLREKVAFFKPGPAGLQFWREHDFTEDPLEKWSYDGGCLELLHRPELDLPELLRLVEHVPAGGEAALPEWLPSVDFGAAARSETPLGETLRTHGSFEVAWEGEDRARWHHILVHCDTIASRDLRTGDEVVFDRGGFVYEKYALAAAADGRCARLLLQDVHALAGVARFSQSAPRLETWDDGTYGCGVFIEPEPADAAPLPARFSLSADRFSVGPLRDLPLQSDDRIKSIAYTPEMTALELHPARSGPGQPRPAPVTMLMPNALALQLWEEWEVAQTRSSLGKATLGGYYRRFNDAKKYSLLAVLFSDIVLLNQALNQGLTMEETIEQLGEAGGKALEENAELRKDVVTKILALVQMLPGIKQKLELMASMYPYYWVNQETEWLKAAFGDETVAGLEASLRKRAVPLVRREVRTVQANLGRALGEIESAARPIQALLSRDEVRKTWTAQARKYLPIGVQGASAVAMIVLSQGTYGWTGLATFLASGVVGNVFEGVTRDAEAVNQIGRAAETILPWWRVFLHVLVTTQFEFSEFIDQESLLAMKRDRELLEKVSPTNKEAATARLVAALRERIIAERRNHFAEVLAGSGVLMGKVIDELETAITYSARADVAEFIKMLQPVRSELQTTPQPTP